MAATKTRTVRPPWHEWAPKPGAGYPWGAPKLDGAVERAVATFAPVLDLSVLLVTAKAWYDPLKAEMDAWIADRKGEGWQARIYVTTAADAATLQAELAGMTGFSHVFVVGKLAIPTSIPMPIFNPDGHADRPIPDPHALKAGCAVGWLMYEDMSNIDPIAQYRLYFQRRHTYTLLGCTPYPLRHRFRDHLDYFGYDMAGQGVDREFYAIRSCYSHAGPHTTPDLCTPPGVMDPELSQQNACTWLTMFSGGHWGGPLLYDVMVYPDPLTYPPKCPFVSIFGSFTPDLDWQNNLGRALLVGNDVLMCILNWWGVFKWSTFINGGTIGQAIYDTVHSMGVETTPNVCWGIGDPTPRLDAATMANLEIVKQLTIASDQNNTLQQQINAIKSGTV